MAGSEQVGLDGADPDLFVGATWVLTPTASTEASAYAKVRQVVSSLGAEVVSLSPEQHDTLVAVVSHVPHLTAATLMNLADAASDKHAALLRLAAGGFRDMTRVAAGHPGIWPDVCAANSDAIVATLDELVGELSSHARPGGRRATGTGCSTCSRRAAIARRSLPAAAVRPERLAELRVPVPDRPGVLAEITTLAGSLGVNISDLEIAHSAEGERGVLVLVVAADSAHVLQEGLADRGVQVDRQGPRMSIPGDGLPDECPARRQAARRGLSWCRGTSRSRTGRCSSAHWRKGLCRAGDCPTVRTLPAPQRAVQALGVNVERRRPQTARSRGPGTR